LSERLDGVRSAVYLIFNEGYTALRGALSAEAIRLGRLLDSLIPDCGQNIGLLALMLLQESRRAARVDSQGRMVLLEDQDLSLWDRGPSLIATATARFSATTGDGQIRSSSS
jgi:RNA polymerase sigma-70 factor, ECF subfamily